MSPMGASVETPPHPKLGMIHKGTQWTARYLSVLECRVLARPRPDPVVYSCLPHALIPHFFINCFVSPQFFSPD
jgi:hypothetical protein